MKNSASQILIRVHRQLHQQLLAQAKDSGLSLNEFCIERLHVPSSLHGQPPLLGDVLEESDRFFGKHLLGLLLYGSRARGDAHSGSDWDFLMVIDDAKPLNRQLYRQWEEQTVHRLPPAIEVNFVHKPSTLRTATGFWSEVALDGIVLYERTFTVSKYLNHVRRCIADGRIVRRTSHGQSYWIWREVA